METAKLLIAHIQRMPPLVRATGVCLLLVLLLYLSGLLAVLMRILLWTLLLAAASVLSTLAVERYLPTSMLSAMLANIDLTRKRQVRLVSIIAIPICVVAHFVVPARTSKTIAPLAPEIVQNQNAELESLRKALSHAELEIEALRERQKEVTSPRQDQVVVPSPKETNVPVRDEKRIPKALSRAPKLPTETRPLSKTHSLPRLPAPTELPPGIPGPSTSERPGLHRAGFKSDRCLICNEFRSPTAQKRHSDKSGFGLCESCGSEYARYSVVLPQARQKTAQGFLPTENELAILAPFAKICERNLRHHANSVQWMTPSEQEIASKREPARLGLITVFFLTGKFGTADWDRFTGGDDH